MFCVDRLLRLTLNLVDITKKTFMHPYELNRRIHPDVVGDDYL